MKPLFETKLPEDVDPELVEQAWQVDVQCSTEPHKNVQAWPLLAALKIPYIVQRDAGEFRQVFLRPAAVKPQAP